VRPASGSAATAGPLNSPGPVSTSGAAARPGRAPGNSTQPGGPGSSPAGNAGNRPGPANPAPGKPPGPNPQPGANPASNDQVDALNRRLGNLLPSGGQVTYTSKHYTNDLAGALEQVKDEYLKKAAPPKDILDKAIARVFRRRTMLQSDAVMYVLSRRSIFGFQICTGWLMELHPLGGGEPEGKYSIAPCASSDFEPSYASSLPTLPPKPAPKP
jgi:hypothetical protein